MIAETQMDVLADISRNLNRIAEALESIVEATVRENPGGPSFMETFTTTREG